jgi:multiple sugar transport system ATP-binding protein
MARLRLEGIEKTFPGGHQAVAGVDLEVAEKELVVLLGPSGCGKSTLLRIVAGIETPTRGRVWIGDEDVTDRPPQGRDIAMVFQNYALYPHMSVRENLGFGLKMRGTEKGRITQRVGEVAEGLGIDSLLDRRPSQLSGGQRQRVALGRAIARKARIFLLDEPLSNLDVQLRLNTRTELARLHRSLDAPMVYVTHDQEEAMTLGDRVAVMSAGKILQIGTPMDVYERPATRFVAGFVGSPRMNFLEGRRSGGNRVSLDDSGAVLLVESVSANDSAVDRLGLAAEKGSIPLDREGRGVVVGIRPEDVEIVSRDDADVRARVDVIEPLGREHLVHLLVDGEQGRDAGVMRVLTAPETHAGLGEKVGLRFRRDRIHLFDAVTEKRIA